MRIQNNLMAMNTHRQLSVNNLNQTKSTEKLSSGYRINRAADDAAGLYISEKMRSQIRGLNMASANAQDGISLVQAAEGALQESHSILQRMRELSVKAANDVNETEDRGAIQSELDQLRTEVDRIAFTTEFNKKTLLDGSLQNGFYTAKAISGRAVATGISVDQSFMKTQVAANTEVEGLYSIAVTTAGVSQSTTFTYDLTGAVVGDTFTVNLSVQDETGGLPGAKDVTSDVFNYVATGNVEVDNAAFVNGLKEALSKVLKDYTVTSSGNTVTTTANGIGTLYGGVTLTTSGSGTVNTDAGQANAATAGVDANVVVSYNGTAFATLDTSDPTQYMNGLFTDVNAGLSFRMTDLTKLGSSILSLQGGKNLTLQVGANTGIDHAIAIGIGSLSASGLGIDNLRVDDHIAAQSSVAAIELAIAGVSNQRSALGAVQNRLEHTVANLDTVSENLQAAESRIRDVDMAKEMMAFTKNNILSQAATAMLAQANQAPQTVLQLLR